ncbi:hypothetical protein ACZ91_41445 [Streptomyces regensis]|nr:hypothetical protein ACZ91_41445 [Streptomyces regensis]
MSRGRDKHIIALLVVPDSVVLEVAVAQAVFMQRVSSIAGLTGDLCLPYEVILCGEQKRHTLASGVDLGELAPLEVMETADTVMVPGVEDPLARRSDALLESLRSAGATGARMVSFCGGAFLLGRAGILDGRRATTHWLFAKEFRTEFPQVRLEPEHLYVDDGPVHTSGGVFSATDLALHLTALDLGQAYANDLGRVLVSAPHRPGGQAQFVKEPMRVDKKPAEESFLQWLGDRVEEPLTLAQLARQANISERSLVRKFRRETGMSVFAWITRERLNRAKALLETTDYRVIEIASMVGFGSYEAFRRNFEADVGVTAVAYRNMFRAAAG